MNNVREAISKLKPRKSDGDAGLTTDYGSYKLYSYISVLFSIMFPYGYVPTSMRQSVFIPIPKNKRKSLNDSENYRGIALSSILGKILDWVILHISKGVLRTSDYQFGFKSEHSTSQCTFVVKETVQYYLNGGSSAYVMLLDASKAFDRVDYLKLFNLLLKKDTCPIVCRLIVMFYTNQSARIKWDNAYSLPFTITNGVKKGGVLSPLLFGIYMDQLFDVLIISKLGCHNRTRVYGSFWVC